MLPMWNLPTVIASYKSGYFWTVKEFPSHLIAKLYCLCDTFIVPVLSTSKMLFIKAELHAEETL